MQERETGDLYFFPFSFPFFSRKSTSADQCALGGLKALNDTRTKDQVHPYQAYREATAYNGTAMIVRTKKVMTKGVKTRPR